MRLYFLLFLFIPPLWAVPTQTQMEHAIGKEAQDELVLTQFQRDFILLKQKKFEFEYTFSHSYSSSNTIYLDSFAILDPMLLTFGEFGIKDIDRFIITNSFTFRAGLTDWLQFDVNQPIVYRNDTYTKIQTNEENHVQDYGAGDTTLSLTAQALRETESAPAVLLSASYKFKNGKSPFSIEDPEKEVAYGSGYESVRFGINLVKTIDPVVVYGGLSYALNLTETVKKTYEFTDENNVTHVRGLHEVDPGDTVSLNFGMGYALSYDTSMFFQYSQDLTLFSYSKLSDQEHPEPTWVRVIGSRTNSAMFKMGAGWSLNRRVSMNVSLGMGLTEDSPDYLLEIRFPMRM